MNKKRLYILLNLVLFVTVCWLMSYYFFDTLFCDGLSLEELKTLLASETVKYDRAVSEYEHYVNLVKEARKRPERFEDIERYLLR
jgi:hypothetical protein